MVNGIKCKLIAFVTGFSILDSLSQRVVLWCEVSWPLSAASFWSEVYYSEKEKINYSLGSNAVY